MLSCPRCQSADIRCWDERQLTWWEKDGSYGNTQVIGCMACNTCQLAFADVNPSDAELTAQGLWCDDDEHDALYRIGWR